MNKLKLYSLFTLAILLIVFGTYFTLVDGRILPIKKHHATVIILTESFIYLLGILIVAPGFKQSPERFVGRFMILTTVQMLSAMSILLAFVYSKQQEVKTLIFHFVCIFVILLIIQSILLIKINNKQAAE